MTVSAFGSTHPANVGSHPYKTNATGSITTAQVRVAPHIRGERLAQRLTVDVIEPYYILKDGDVYLGHIDGIEDGVLRIWPSRPFASDEIMEVPI